MKNKCIYSFFLIYIFSCAPVKKQKNFDSIYPKQVAQLHLENLYEKALIDFYLSTCSTAAYKKTIKDQFATTDRSNFVQLYKCPLSLDTIERFSDSAIFYFSYYERGKRIIFYEWPGCFNHPLGLEYRLSDEKLLKKIGTVVESSGTYYDREFRKELLDSTKIEFLRKNLDSINPTIRYLINKQYPNLLKI